LSKRPKITVVIPAFEREARLRSCLVRLAPGAQSLAAGEYEVIVSDDSRSAEIAELVRREFPWARWIRGPRRGPAANRNSGANSATGDWIVFTDDDCLPSREWLFAFSEAMERDAADLLEGRTVCPDRTNAATEEIIENLHGDNFWTCNLAVRREIFQALGGFDEDFREPAQEDLEFAARAKARGIEFRFVENAIVHHPARRLNLVQLWTRALMVRWFSLYLLKTRAGWAEKGLAAALISVCSERAANLLRLNWKLLRDWRANTPARTAFIAAWNFLIFPILLPYVLYWEIRFRKSLAERETGRLRRAVHATPGS
jgi:GT2 family glycosyltransferase